MNNIENTNIRHVAIIMDGNGRWAKKKGKVRIEGHKEGIKAMFRAINFSINKIKVLTLYAFSSENWKRPKKEVSDLMNLFVYILKKKVKILKKKKIRINFIGNTKVFCKNLKKYIKKTEKITKKNKKLILNIAINYGGRWDIIQSAVKIAHLVKLGHLEPKEINEKIFCKFICINEFFPVDLVIRTGGEYRISNFLLWQIAYSELFFTKVLWPDFDKKIFEQAILSFSKRKRKFGGIVSKKFEE
ncbi:polyprenyl diphosphate synthase [bacterium endosymbiont of Pedicinus badii]|uniref:polyprenyl diphosphate synthase n=1 Tax=bacterium endosymbiont of Pedicinus badii TaxID=1719126 RepID=UPI0009CD94E9|nr:polyprenyl diphosphate synthase [bacterium endosymbiont of Pedicinus badii]OQM33996.1 UDP pyrophosphate synthase [bacterium endosymbiont of Pedicinus badii]